MKELARIATSYKHFSDPVTVRLWEHGDAFPSLGKSVGIDTETELITDCNKAPDVVILGCFDPSTKTCWQVMWQDIPEFVSELCSRSIEQRYFNAGFDQMVIDNEMPDDMPILNAADRDRVLDMQVRVQLHNLSTVGYIVFKTRNLAGCTEHYEGVHLDKGDGTEESDRLSFRRGTPVTESQHVYLAHDCISTWCIGEAVPRMKTEEVATKGAIVLANISRNGIDVDMPVFRELLRKLEEEKDMYAEKLRVHNFPLKQFKPKVRTKQEIEDATAEALTAIGIPEDVAALASTKLAGLRKIIVMLHEGGYTIKTARESYLSEASEALATTSPTAAQTRVIDKIIDDLNLGAFMSNRRARPAFLADTFHRFAFGTPVTIYQALEETASSFDLDMYPAVEHDAPKPKQVLQEHIQHLIDLYPDLSPDAKTPVSLSMTASGSLKLAKDDMWKLKQLGVEDQLLADYIGYKHAEKLASTYLNSQFIASDNKIHARFSSLVRTTRTSCSVPNLQNIPARDKKYPIRNMFKPQEGTYMCATDFNFIELVSFAESCIQRFGFSVMGSIINANVDPHLWFAGVTNGYIDSSIEFTKSDDAVADMKKFLKEKVSKEQRQHAKAANFG